MKFSLLLISGVSFFFSISNAAAQDTAQALDPVVISASLSSQRLSETGRNITVITGSEISRMPVHSIDELLRYLPGVEVQSRGPFGAQSDISLRGGTFQQVLVIVDGLRVNDPNTGHFTGYVPVSPYEIDRIEILKGPASAIYGSEAVGGVIHIITKTFAGTSPEGLRLNGQLSAGAYKFLSEGAGLSFKKKKTSLFVGVENLYTSGQQQRGARGNLSSDQISASLREDFSDRLFLTVRSVYDHRKFGAQNFYTNFLSDTAGELIGTFWSSADLSYRYRRNTVRLDMGYKALQDEYRFNPISAANENRSRLLQGSLIDDLRFTRNTSLVFGGQFINKQIKSNDRGNHHTNLVAGFISLASRAGEHMHIDPSLRVEWNERTQWQLVPQLNLAFACSNFTVRASGGKTIRDADFTERFNNYQKSFVSGGRLGNPDLSEEKSWSYEVGADLKLGSALKLASTFFQRFHQDLIDYVVTPYAELPRKANLSPTGSYSLAKNIASVDTKGAEFDFIFGKMNKALSGGQAMLGILWLESRTSGAMPSLYLLSHAKWLVNFSLSYRIRHLDLSVTGLYKVRRPQPASPQLIAISKDYFVANAKVNLWLVKEILALFVEVDNFLDREYADLLGAQMPGRWVMGGFKLNLSK